MKDFKFKTSFSSIIKCILDEDFAKSISLASIEELKNIIPEDALKSGREDLLPIASNLAVINLMNLNGDALGTDTVLQYAETLIHKPINIEHNRGYIIGHVTNIAYSKFNSSYKIGVGSEIISRDSIKETNAPFNLSYAGYLYKLVDETLIDDVIESSNPDSPKYLTIASSWEVGFNEYDIAVGSIELSSAKIISDSTEKDYYSRFLRCYGGKGKTENGEYVYRVIKGEIMFLGAALTTNPAALVSGVITPIEEDTEDDKEGSDSKVVANQLENQKIISQIKQNNVKDNDKMKTIKSIDEIKSLKQEEMAEVSIASISETIYNEIKKVSEDWSGKIKDKESALLKAQEDSKVTTEQLEQVKKELGTIKAQQAAIEAEKVFNQRMAHLDENYELDDEQRKAIVSDITSLDEENFTKWFAKFEVLAKKCKKEKKAATSEASNSENDEEAKKLAQQALENAEAERKAKMANATSTQTNELETYRKQFSLEGLKIS